MKNVEIDPERFAKRALDAFDGGTGTRDPGLEMPEPDQGGLSQKLRRFRWLRPTGEPSPMHGLGSRWGRPRWWWMAGAGVRGGEVGDPGAERGSRIRQGHGRRYRPRSAPAATNPIAPPASWWRRALRTIGFGV